MGGRVVVFFLWLALVGALATPAGAQDAPRHYPLGIYIASVHDVDVAGRTAAIDMWLWSLSPDGRRPLKTVELVNGADYTRSLASTQSRPQGAWSQVKVSGTFHQIWDFSDFPFDRQTVSVVLEEGVLDASAFRYQVDHRDSAYDPAIEIPGWRITGMDVRPRMQRYHTTFGDPLLSKGGHSDYSRVVAELHMRRDGAAMTFFKLTAALYAAIFLTLATFFLRPDTMSDLGARMGLLAAALFAVVLNMSQASNEIGAPTGLSLLDELHIVAFALIIVATVIGIGSRRRLERGADPARVRRFDHRSFAVCALLAVAANVALIATVA